MEQKAISFKGTNKNDLQKKYLQQLIKECEDNKG